MEGQGAHIPKFGDWKTTDSGAPYTMFFESARKRRSMGGTTPPPSKPPSHGNSVPPGHRRADGPRAQTPKDPASRSRSQSSVGSVPAWGQWNESNAAGGGGAGGAQHEQYTLVFDQIREERGSAPWSTPHVEQLQRPAPARVKRRDTHRDHVPKIFTCFDLCGK